MEVMLTPYTGLAILCLFQPRLGRKDKKKEKEKKGKKKKKWWPVRHHSGLEYRSASVLAAAFLAQSRGRGDKLAGEEGLSHAPSPAFQCTENPSSAP